MESNPNTREIPREQWPRFFDDIGKRYEGWAVTVEIVGRDLGDQHEGTGLPLQGLSFEKAGSEAGDILIEAGDITPYSGDDAAYIVHHIDCPRAVRWADTQPGSETAIELESADGRLTIVRIRRPAELPPPSDAANTQQWRQGRSA